jgi:hypothetical protein
VCPRAGLDDMERKIFLAFPNSKSNPSAVQPVACLYSDCATVALYIIHIRRLIREIRFIIIVTKNDTFIDKLTGK